MLPDLRAIIAATIATLGLLMIAFGAVAAFRIAQASHGALQADLTKRARMAELRPVRHPITVIDTPGPHIAPFPPLPVVEVKDAPIATELHDVPSPASDVAPKKEPEKKEPEKKEPEPAATAQAVVTPEPPSAPEPPKRPDPIATLLQAEPPLGGPLAGPRPTSEAERAAARAEQARKLAAANRARAARLARQRKAAAARRAAEARVKQQQTPPTPFNPLFGNSNFNLGSGNQ